MEDCGPRNAENFEEMKVSKFRWLLGALDLKKATESQASCIFIYYLLFMVAGVAGIVVGALRPDITGIFWVGAASLVVAILLAIYLFHLEV